MTAPHNRRGFLRGLALVSASAGTGALALASPTSAKPNPDAVLLALGADLDAEAARFREADEALAQAIAGFEAIEPPIPEDLAMARFSLWCESEWPPDALGYCNASRVHNRVRIPDRHHLDERVKRLDGRTLAGRYARHLKKVSDAFHEAHEAARIKAGVPKAESARHRSGQIIADLNVKIGDTTAVTLAGLAVKGRSELAWVGVNRAQGYWRERPGIIALFENLAALGGSEAVACASS